MAIILLLLLLVFSYITYLFVSQRASPVPYFPSNTSDIPLIVKSLKLKKGQIVWDLGAGDGAVIFAAAEVSHQKKLNTIFVAVEINPALIAVLHLRRLFHPNRRNIYIIKANIFTMQFSDLNSQISTNTSSQTFFTYISPWHMEKTVANIARQHHSFHHVSYFYKAPKSNKYRARALSARRSVHDVYEYNISSTKRQKKASK